ncbi:FtsX-like permease family protein [Streptomyces sp. NPDC051561]|uniref:FtsX-like permease family protein n=1 Tax=Streptomyces sp. NPDC051561 TaxID=3365658 RepID=UPI00379A9097
MTGFVFLRVRAHRLLLSAALLAVVLTTAVLAALAAFSGSIGDAGLRHSLGVRDATASSLLVQSGVPASDRAQADAVVRDGARRVFDGLPTRQSTLEQSAAFALPPTLQSPSARKDKPDLTRLAGLDRSRVKLSRGNWPANGVGADGVIEVALPAVAAKQLKLSPGSAVIPLAARIGTGVVKVRLTGLYEPKQLADPYWRLEELGGRGIRTATFTTYGPLLVDPAVLSTGKVAADGRGWLVSADFRTVDSGRITELRAAAVAGLKHLTAQPPFSGQVSAETGLPRLLDQADRALLVSRSTLVIVSLQLILLASYALLLVARLLSSERAGETELLIARGSSRRRVVVLAAVEAVLLAVPAAVCAPLVSGPLTTLLSGQGSLGRIGLRLDTGGVFASAGIWLVGAGVGLLCAVAVVAPALTAGRGARSRVRAVPGPMKAGADIALLLIAVVAYWQLDRQTSGSGPLGESRGGALGVDPLLVAAPALALLAGTVLTLRLLPPLAKLAEKRAAKGRGLPAALAGWQLSRRPLRGAGPVLLIVLAVAMGMLAIGQGASWDRSQEDQADFRSGSSIRVAGTGSSDSARGNSYAAIDGVRSAAPAARTGLPLSGGRTATVLALDTSDARENLRLRGDLVDGDYDALAAKLRTGSQERVGILLPEGPGTLDLALTLRRPDGKPSKAVDAVTATVEDRYGMTYRLAAGQLTADGRESTLSVDVSRLAGPLRLTGMDASLDQPYLRGESHVLSLKSLAKNGTSIPRPGAGFKWLGTATDTAGEAEGAPDAVSTLAPAAAGQNLFEVTYRTGASDVDPELDGWGAATPQTVVRISAARPPATDGVGALATDDFMRHAGAAVGSRIDFDLHGTTLTVTLVGTLRQLPTTGPGSLATDGLPVDPAKDGGALLVDLRAVNHSLAPTGLNPLMPSEWWLSTDSAKTADVAAALRERPDIDPAQVLVRDEALSELHDDPLGAGPQSALLAVAVVAALLAAVGFAVGAAGSLRERAAEFAVLRALGTPPRQLARLIAAEHSVLIALALVVGIALGAVLTRAVIPLIVLTGQATQPQPNVLVQLPAGQIALLLTGVVAIPLLVVAALALRRGDPATMLRIGGGN